MKIKHPSIPKEIKNKGISSKQDNKGNLDTDLRVKG